MNVCNVGETVNSKAGRHRPQSLQREHSRARIARNWREFHAVRTIVAFETTGLKTMADTQHVALLSQGVAAWNAWRAEQPSEVPQLEDADLTALSLDEFDLSGANLRSANLAGSSLNGVNFAGARLLLANLGDSNLCQVDFTNADLTGAEMQRCNLVEVIFRRADLSWSNLSCSNVKGVVFEAANLTGTNLRRSNIIESDFTRANLIGTDLEGSNLHQNIFRKSLIGLSAGATIRMSDSVLEDVTVATGNCLSGLKMAGRMLAGAHLRGVKIAYADLRGANLCEADLSGADLRGTDVRNADLQGAKFERANLEGADLRNANAAGALMRGCILDRADLSGANLAGADLSHASLVNANAERAVLSGCRVFGAAVWGLRFDGAQQRDLVVSEQGGSMVTTTNIEVAQFLYVLLNNSKIRSVIDTIASKVVLILGRFTPQRKRVLDAIRDELGRRDYLPVVFDFDRPTSRDITETVSTLAHLSRFVIADITEARSIPQELMAVVPALPSVPVKPLLQQAEDEYGMFEHFKRYPWVLPAYRYLGPEDLIANLPMQVIAPSEAKAKELRPNAVGLVRGGA